MKLRTQTSQRIHPINVHRTTPTDALPTAPPKRQRRINLILDPDQRIQHHRPRLVQVKRVRLHPRLRRRLVRIPTVHVEGLDAASIVLCRSTGRWFFHCRRLALRLDGTAGGRCFAEFGDWFDGGKRSAGVQALWA